MKKNKELEEQIKYLDVQNGYKEKEIKIKKSQKNDLIETYEQLVKKNRITLQNTKYKMDKNLVFEKKRIMGIY